MAPFKLSFISGNAGWVLKHLHVYLDLKTITTEETYILQKVKWHLFYRHQKRLLLYLEALEIILIWIIVPQTYLYLNQLGI